MHTQDFLPARERFLPFQPAALLEHVLKDPRLAAGEREQMRALFQMVAARFHFEFREQLEELKRLYDPFDPDRDTLPLAEHTPESLAAQRDQLRADFRKLLVESNYVELSRQQIEKCIEADHDGPVHVVADLSDYLELCVFYRGVKQERRPRHWWHPRLRREPEDLQVFSRTALLVRPAGKPSDCTYIKLFKNIVVADLEMLLPKVHIRMKLMDKAQIGSTVAGGIGTACWKAFSAAVLSPWVFLTLLSGFAGATLKGIFGFLSSKTHYIQALSSSLYYQNLGNNTSALALLVDTAEAEEAKELLLAYYMLYVERHRDLTEPQLDQRIEQWLREQFALDVDFEVADALRKLREKGLVAEIPAIHGQSPGAAGASAAQPVLKVYDLPSALRRLDETWDNYFASNGHADPTQDRLADGAWPPVAAPSAGDNRRAA